MTDPLGPVVITSREIYDQLVRVGTALTDLASQIGRLNDSHDETRRDVSDHEMRIRSLERRQLPLPTVALLLSLAGVALSVFVLLR